MFKLEHRVPKQGIRRRVKRVGSSESENTDGNGRTRGIENRFRKRVVSTEAKTDASRILKEGGISHLEAKQVPVSSLKHHPLNARVGDVGMIVESLEVNGQFRAIGVQKSTGYVVYGNHTSYAFEQLKREYSNMGDGAIRQRLMKLGTPIDTVKTILKDKWQTIWVHELDIDDETSKRILLADNRANDLADYDWEAQTKILESMASLAGTGYLDAELKALQDIAVVALDSSDDELELPGAIDDSADDYTLDADEELPELAGEVNTLNTDVVFLPTGNLWDIPEIKLDMIPVMPNVAYTSWNSPVVSIPQDTGSNYFMYIYSTYSTRGMPWDRSILAFYVHDERFENWWDNPAHYVQKYLDLGLWAMVQHDYSRLDDMPLSQVLWNIYRAAWLARFAQEAGLQVIPNLMMFHNSKGELYDWSIASIPKGAPTVSIELQNNAGSTKQGEREFYRRLREVHSILQFDTLVNYAGNKGQRLVDESRVPCRVIHVDNRSKVKEVWRRNAGPIETQ